MIELSDSGPHESRWTLRINITLRTFMGKAAQVAAKGEDKILHPAHLKAGLRMENASDCTRGRSLRGGAGKACGTKMCCLGFLKLFQVIF